MTEWVGVGSRVKQKGVSWEGDVVSRANQEEVRFCWIASGSRRGLRRQPRSQHTELSLTDRVSRRSRVVLR